MKRFFTFAALLLVVTVPILLQPSAAQEQEVPESDQFYMSWIEAKRTCLADEAFELGKLTSGVDTLPGSQESENAHWHGMRDPKWSHAEAQDNFDRYTRDNRRSCKLDDLGKALHAVRDSPAPGHRGLQPWPGWPWDPNGVSWPRAAAHVLGDIHGSSLAAQRETGSLLREWCKKCRSCE